MAHAASNAAMSALSNCSSEALNVGSMAATTSGDSTGGVSRIILLGFMTRLRIVDPPVTFGAATRAAGILMGAEIRRLTPIDAETSKNFLMPFCIWNQQRKLLTEWVADFRMALSKIFRYFIILRVF